MSTAEKKFYTHLVISLILFVLMRFIPAVNGLTPIGVNVLSIFVPVLYMWLTIGTDWPSWLAMALVIFTGVMTPGEVYSGVFGSSLIITVIGVIGTVACVKLCMVVFPSLFRGIVNLCRKPFHRKAVG